MHTLLDLRGGIPCFVHVSHGKTHDTAGLDALVVEPGTFYVMDRGYVDFARLYALTQQMAYFVVRSKKNLAFTRHASQPIDRTGGLRSDQTIVLSGPKSSQHYPVPLRRITLKDAESGTRFVFLTNHFDLDAQVIADLYRCRWQIELFFKWIKQHLRIKAFYGTSENAVKTQVWIAVTIYVLVAIVKRELDLTRSLSEILQILSITIFEKTPILQAISQDDDQNSDPEFHNSLPLYDF